MYSEIVQKHCSKKERESVYKDKCGNANGDGKKENEISDEDI